MVSGDDALNDLREDLRRFVERRAGDAAAEDLVQEVLLRAHERRDELSTPAALRHWSFRVAANLVVDHYRRRRGGAVALDDAPEAMSAGSASEPGEASRGLASCAARMAETLPAPYRRAVQLVELGGMTQHQAAGVLGLSVSGAKSRVQRGRAELRRMLLDCCHVELDRRGGVVDYAPTAKAERYCGGKDFCVRSAGPASSGVKGGDGRGLE